MNHYIADYFDEVRDHLREALDALAYCLCSGLCFVVLMLTLPLLMVYSPLVLLGDFLMERRNNAS